MAYFNGKIKKKESTEEYGGVRFAFIFFFYSLGIYLGISEIIITEKQNYFLV